MHPLFVLIRVSSGELIDRITILEIRASRITDHDRRAEIVAHLEQLVEKRDRHLAHLPAIRELGADLKAVNAEGWGTESTLREHERRQDFGPAFVALARNVYWQNDRRSAIKRQIDLLTGSEVLEEKLYPDYRTPPGLEKD